MTIAIGSDHVGFDLKEKLPEYVNELSHEAIELGTHSNDPVDYPDYAEAVGLAMREGRVQRRRRLEKIKVLETRYAVPEDAWR